eukprot:TRINITY_DN6689_c0_g2_i1.p2 TRINITY_DN6689_c0_g2~~TRINITY_DN6689_c0_g2_i1.p2  ORF type:complete len:169 (-),score=54.46 TRINITY_DN6689_c0_g2_i1:32-538(-)
MSQTSDEYRDENVVDEFVERGEEEEDEEEGEDLFDEQNLFRDYLPSRLDHYEEEEGDLAYEDEIEAMGYEEQQRARRAAERALNRRDQHGLLLQQDGDDNDNGDADDDMEVESSYEEQKDGGVETVLGGRVERGKLEDWIAQEPGRTEVHCVYKAGGCCKRQFLHCIC